MQSININDSLYATLYYKAYKIDPKISQIVPRPGFDQYQRGYPGAQTSQNFIPNQQSNGKIGYHCYGCRKSGHNMRNCDKINQLSAQGTIKQDKNRKLTMGDGSPIAIVQSCDEPFVQAIHKMTARTAAKTNFIALGSYPPDLSSESESALYTSNTFIVATDRPIKASKGIRKQKTMFEAVFPLLWLNYVKGKSSWMCGDSPINSSGQDHADVAQPVAAQPTILHGIVFDPHNDDTVMEDTLPMPVTRRLALTLQRAPSMFY